MPRTCIVVAEQSRARFFLQEKKGGKLNETADLINENARLLEQDLVSDRPGRSFDIMGSGRHAMESKSSAKKQAATRFAMEICDYLEKTTGTFENLVIVSSPTFLSLLRKKMPDSIAKLVSKEFKKNLVQKDAGDIEQILNK